MKGANGPKNMGVKIKHKIQMKARTQEKLKRKKGTNTYMSYIRISLGFKISFQKILSLST